MQRALKMPTEKHSPHPTTSPPDGIAIGIVSIIIIIIISENIVECHAHQPT